MLYRIKPLVWDCEGEKTAWADSVFGVYYAYDDGQHSHWSTPSKIVRATSMADAKAGAQAHYEARLLKKVLEPVEGI